MRRLVFIFLMLFALPTKAFSVASISCGIGSAGYLCFGAANKETEAEAQTAARDECTRFNPNFPIRDCKIVGTTFSNTCRSIYTPFDSGTFFTQEAPIAEDARRKAEQFCTSYQSNRRCRLEITLCDYGNFATPPSAPEANQASITNYTRSASSAPQANPQVQITNDNASALPTASPWDNPDFVRNIIIYNWLRTGVPFIAGIIVVLLAFANRARLANLIIHGNLPYKTEFPADDIQVSFIRKQRVNWYGRVVFGFVVQLGLTEQQLLLVRRYWLGRVVAFDSLRRQRQNELASLHLALAARAKSDPHDKKKFWSRRWATLRSFTKKLFWVLIALTNFILSFFFIRVIVAKLVRGTLIESKDLLLLMQAKEAIELTSQYLKEYLLLAETFDGHEELHEP